MSTTRIQSISYMVRSVEYARVPDAMKPELRSLLGAMIEIHAAPNKSRAIRIQAIKLKAWKGTSRKSIEKKYYKWREADQDWFALVDKARMPATTTSLPDAFIELWHQFFLSNQRKGKPAWRQLVAFWKSGNPIAGYETAPEVDPLTDLPFGWSYGNLMHKKRKPTKYETTAARIGRSAASKHRPKVPMTRVGLSVGQFYMFDDMWQDFKVAVPGQRGSRRILSLHALDLLSGNLFASGHKPTMWNEEESKMEHLKEKEMVFLLLHVLSNIGYRGEGCVLIAEHGTAAVPPRLEQALYDWSGGLITVERGGIMDNPACAGMFAGPKKGNFRFKAWLESLHNLIHNETADAIAFPAQTGSNSRLNAPEQLHGREQYLKRLLKAGDRMGVEQASKLVLPFLNYSEAVQRIEMVYQAINNRDDHSLEGWAKCGFTRPAWRLDTQQGWQDVKTLDAYPAAKREAIMAFVGESKELFGSMRLSPAQVFNHGRHSLARIPNHILPQLFGPELGREVNVGQDNLISFSDADLDDERLHYEPLLIDTHGREQMLRAGEKHLGYVNPHDLDTLHLCDAKGGYLGHVARQQRTCRADADALQRATGRAAKIEAELLAPVIRGQRGMTAQMNSMRRNNSSVIRNKQPRQDPSIPGLADLMGNDPEPVVTEPENTDSLRDLF